MGIIKSKQAPVLTAEEKIVAAQARVAQSMNVFRKAEEDVKEAQEELAKVIMDARAEIDKQTAIIEKAQSEFDYNDKVRLKLSEFSGQE